DVLRVRRAVDRDELRRRVLRLEDDFTVAEADAIAAAERRRRGEARAVQQRSVDATAVANDPLAAAEDDFGVVARQETVADRDRAVGRPAKRDGLLLERHVERSRIRLIHRELDVFRHNRKRSIIGCRPETMRKLIIYWLPVVVWAAIIIQATGR